VITVQPEKDKSTGKDKKTIGIDPIRDQVLHRAHQRPQEGRRQIFIIDDAHQVTLAAFNALLKTLEEPSPDTVFIIITPNLHALPQTVVSRCRRLSFRFLGREEQRRILEANLDGEAVDLDRLISLSLGRLGKAFGADPEALAGRRESAMELLGGLSEPPGKADEAALILLAASLAGGGGQSRVEVLEFLEMLLGLLRDILALKVAPDVLEPWNVDLQEALEVIGSRWGISGLICAMDRVGAATRDVGEINTNPSLTLESLVISLRATVCEGE
jgi:DNA polymerase III gamma/tau subunit